MVNVYGAIFEKGFEKISTETIKSIVHVVKWNVEW